eukprot:1900570-Rhodomonas_salina.1
MLSEPALPDSEEHHQLAPNIMITRAARRSNPLMREALMRKAGEKLAERVTEGVEQESSSASRWTASSKSS